MRNKQVCASSNNKKYIEKSKLKWRTWRRLKVKKWNKPRYKHLGGTYRSAFYSVHKSSKGKWAKYRLVAAPHVKTSYVYLEHHFTFIILDNPCSSLKMPLWTSCFSRQWFPFQEWGEELHRPLRLRGWRSVRSSSDGRERQLAVLLRVSSNL